MEQRYNNKTHKHEWVLVNWYNKLAFVMGWVWVILFILGFIVGFASA